MVYLVLFFLELITLFFLSRVLTRSISYVLMLLFNSKRVAVYSLALLFFPGTVIHELSHFLMAIVLFVPTGKIHLFPKIDHDGVRLGSVGIAQTDMLRRVLIGAAPFLFGTAILLTLLWYITTNELWENTLYFAVALYSVFVIGNTMFSSKKDREGMLGFFLILLFAFILLYIQGIRLNDISVTIAENSLLKNLFERGSFLLAIPIILDITVITVFVLLRRLFNR